VKIECGLKKWTHKRGEWKKGRKIGLISRKKLRKEKHSGKKNEWK
jgi:hypothetical protein